MPRKKANPSEETGPNFEKAMAELEQIVGAMEEDQLPLEDLVAKFEQGTQLLTHCESVLASAKKRLQTIAAQQSAPDSSLSPDTSDESDDTDDDDDIRLF
ncbi:exodeoxyribonuclease VII small subunit [Haloferula sp.]|uniref:exodeoxyribonuclease VII small subunit n=1 Tax=Haloferula sp. TaxID=2497595 RepID=UPI003C793399